MVPWVMPMPRVAGGDVDVWLVAGVAADEGEESIGSMTWPDQRNSTFSHHREPLARPFLQLRVALVGVVGLAGLVVLAADDQHVVVADGGARRT